MGRFANSWTLTKVSLKVVSQDRELLLMPILSFFASLVSLALVLGIGFTTRIPVQIYASDHSLNLPGLGLAVLLYILLAFIQTYFFAAVIASASQRLAGGNPTLGSALGAANKRIGRLFLWSIVVGLMNVLMQMLRERGGAVGRLVAGLGSLAWSVATYFVVPVLMFEDEPVLSSIGRSSSLLRKTWGEAAIGGAGAGVVFMIGYLLLVLTGFLLFSAGAALGLGGIIAVAVILVVAFVLLACLQSVVSGVYRAALYRFATTGNAGAGFSSEMLGAAFVRKA